ncbi:MAG TPA: beta-ketoacyl synthase N-terminal-like domain-containing protein, partial [Candidatus Polarisedimenticolia bacterium]|nr:beta-ketoacyl synthase N-terminal-like domain-containing protein [Candidatus Polarisedimenticolia bacterium]
RRMSPPSRFAIAAAGQALAEAGLARGETIDPETAVVAASVFGPASFTTRLFDQILDEGPSSASPMLFSECVANAAVAQVNVAAGAGGPSFALAQGEAGPLRAVARAACEIEAGRARRAIAGAVEELPPVVHAFLDRLGALARSGGAGEQGRPFDRRRDGYHAAEGATFLVLEEAEDAARRGAAILARVIGGFSGFDATAPAGGWGRGAAVLARVLTGGLERLGLAPAGIDLIVSGASGSRHGDRLEAQILQAAWGARPLPPVLAPKAVTGEYGGAFLAAAILAAEGKGSWDASWYAGPDEGCGIAPHAGPVPDDARTLLVTSLAAGGSASWLVLARP